MEKPRLPGKCVGKLFPWGESRIAGPTVTPGAVRVGRHHVLLIFESQSILHRAWRLFDGRDRRWQLERGARVGRVGPWLHPSGFCVCRGVVQCRRGAGSREQLLSLTLRWDLCQRQDGRAVSVSPARWTGSRSFAEIMRGARSSFLSLKGFARPSCRMGRESLGTWLLYRTSSLSAVTLPRIEGAVSLGKGTAEQHGQA